MNLRWFFNSPFCKAEVRAMGLGDSTHWFLWAFQNLSLLRSLLPSPSLLPPPFPLSPRAAPSWPCCCLSFLGSVVRGGWNTDEVNEHSCVAEVVVFISLMIYKEFCCRLEEERATMWLNCWGGHPSTMWQHFLVSLESLQALWRFWAGVGFCLDIFGLIF